MDDHPPNTQTYEPGSLEPGAEVTWRQEGYIRTGQVWSEGDVDRTLWVVPFKPYPGEVLVLLRAELRYVRTASRPGAS